MEIMQDKIETAARADLRNGPAVWACAFILTVIGGSLAGCSEDRASAAPPRPAVPVIVAKVEQRDVPLEVHAIGNVLAYSMVQVKSLVGAQLDKAYFKEGDDVRKGQLLFTLDKRQIQADLAQAEANMARDEAQLANAKANAARSTELLKAGVISQQDYDAASANANALEAAVVADRAAVQNQKVQLSYTDIYSPIDGRTGSLAIYPGNLIKANDTPFLVTINEIQPIYVEFALPEQQLALVKEYSTGQKLPVLAHINGVTEPAEGSLTFLDNTVDTTTGTIKLKATFENRDRKLWPGQFVDVSLKLAVEKSKLVIPASAVQTGLKGQYVYVVKPDLTVEDRVVTVGRTLGPITTIEKGLQQGETVVTDGQVRLQPNAKVEIKQGSASNGSSVSGYTSGY